MARFGREARLLAALNHPNIATIHGIEETDGVHGLVMELVEGPTLSDKLTDHAQRSTTAGLPLAEALRVGGQIAEALEAAHEKGVIHRDLKPANIKLTRDGHVKILDFGLAKSSSSDGSGGDGVRPADGDDQSRGWRDYRNTGVHEPGTGARPGRRQTH